MFGGSLSETHAQKICRLMDRAMRVRRIAMRFGVCPSSRSDKI